MTRKSWSALYTFWATAVCSRALWQYYSRTGDLVPTHLSLLAGIIYIIIAWAAYTGRHRVMLVGLGGELIGLIGISTYELFTPFSYATAWSHFGSGYLYLPLILPCAGIGALWRRLPPT